MKRQLFLWAFLQGVAAGQAPAREGEAPKLEDLRRQQAENRSRLDRLIELKILMDLGGNVPPEVLAALLPAGSRLPDAELAEELRSQEQRVSAGRERLAAARQGVDLRPPSVEPTAAAAPDTREAGADTAPTAPASRPAESRPVVTVQSRPSGPPAVTLVRAVPSLPAVYTLLQCGQVEEARAVLANFPDGALPPALVSFLQAGIAEHSGDLAGAERTLLKAMAEETSAGNTKGAQFEAMKLALDHVTWKKNRAEFSRLLAGPDKPRQGK